MTLINHNGQGYSSIHTSTNNARSLRKRSPSQESKTSVSSPSSSVRTSPQQNPCRPLTNISTHQGANDSRLPDTPGGPQQNVPLTDRPDLRIILITPPPVDERMLRAADSGNIPGYNGLRRTAETTRKYAEAVKGVAKEKGVQACDVWSAMMREAGWDEDRAAPLPGSEAADENAVLRAFFSDGKSSF
jgi:hypothetical protein